MASQLLYLAYVLLVYLVLALPIALLAYFASKKLPVKQKILAGFLIYGLLSGIISSYWWRISDMPWIGNLPGEFIGYWLHSANFWFLDLPQVFVPASVIFWGVLGLLVQKVWDTKKGG